MGRIGPALWLALGAAACDPVVRVKGFVHDEAGRPIDAVIVTLTVAGRSPRVTSTAPDGRFSVGMVGAKPERSKVSFAKDGYKSIERPLASESRPVIDVVLDRR